eukprot:646424-Rhodomonas_salina.3
MPHTIETESSVGRPQGHARSGSAFLCPQHTKSQTALNSCAEFCARLSQLRANSSQHAQVHFCGETSHLLAGAAVRQG